MCEPNSIYHMEDKDGLYILIECKDLWHEYLVIEDGKPVRTEMLPCPYAPECIKALYV